MSTHPKELRVYLNDHRAGATAGTALARRLLENNEDGRLAVDLAVVLREISADAATLEAIAQDVSIPGDPVKRLLARASEIVSRVKLSTGVHRHSPLTRMVELELLMAGIDQKRSLWRALGAASIPELSPYDFEQLARRATEQRDRLLPHHVDASRAALRPDQVSESTVTRP